VFTNDEFGGYGNNAIEELNLDEEINKETDLINETKKKENELLMPLIQSGMSMSPDMKFGWKPKDEISGAPIPLYYEFEQFSIPINPLTNEEYDPLYLGPRYKHSLAIHKVFAN